MDRLAQLPPFIYRGDQPPPRSITRARIDPSVDAIFEGAFHGREQLTEVEVHERVQRIERGAFFQCKSLTGFNFQLISTIEELAFYQCISLGDIEFGDKLESIGVSAFAFCTSIRRIKITAGSMRISIRKNAFGRCRNLTDVVIGKGLEEINECAFDGCTSLRRIRLSSIKRICSGAFRNCEHLAEFDFPVDLLRIEDLAFGGCTRLARISIPLNVGIVTQSSSMVFDRCERLSKAELVGDIHEKISLLGLKEWQNVMNEEISSINQSLPHASNKTTAIHRWLVSVQNKIDHYKLEHNKLLKESLTLLELVLWKIKLDEMEKSMLEVPTKKAKMDWQSGEKETNTISTQDVRAQCRLDSNATVVIENVFPFLYKFKDE